MVATRCGAYLLEVSVAAEVPEDWRSHRGSDDLSAEEKCRVVTYYARDDAYPPN
jgi:hypothetical protein